MFSPNGSRRGLQSFKIRTLERPSFPKELQPTEPDRMPFTDHWARSLWLEEMNRCDLRQQSRGYGSRAPVIPTDETKPLMTSDRLARSQILGHFQMVAQCRKSLIHPILQFRILAALGIALEQ